MSNEDGRGTGAEAAARLAALGTVTIECGLSDDEIARAESEFGFRFAGDHRAFLSTGLPVGASWPNWRDARSAKALRIWLRSPVQGVLFDVEWGGFWHDGWGPKPARMKHALRTAEYRLARVPHMGPVFGHRYLPAGTGSAGHPVLAISKTHVSRAGDDLAEYIDAEFGLAGSRASDARVTVEFWSDLLT